MCEVTLYIVVFQNILIKTSLLKCIINNVIVSNKGVINGVANINADVSA